MTDWNIPDDERAYLRELARRQAEIAALPVMEERKKMWFALNDGDPGARPPVVIETWTFDRDFMPTDIFRCQSPWGRGVEAQLLRHIRNHELIDDDKVTPDTFDIGWFVNIDHIGVHVATEAVPDAQGVSTGYRFLHPVKDIRTDLDILKPPACSVDREGTLAWKACLDDLLGDLLPVAIRSGFYGNTMLTQQVVVLMGMEAYFLALYDAPDEVHRLMGILRDNCLAVMRWAEAEGLLCLNNGNQDSFGSSSNFTTRLPTPGYNGGPARLCDMWGSANSQETVGLSPSLFHEFCYPYYRDVCEPLGLVYYGCCEPVDPFWDDLKDLPHLKKASVSRWADESFLGEALAGAGVVYSRKPDPNLLGVYPELDEEAWAKSIRATLDATRGTSLEFIVRDVYTVHGRLDKPRRAVEIVRREIDRTRA